MRICLSVFLLLNMVGCVTKTPEVQEFSRYIYSMEKHTIMERQTYKLQITDRDSLVFYKYLHANDSSRNLNFVYVPDKDVLRFAGNDFEKMAPEFFFESTVSLIPFDLYTHDGDVMDINGPMLFNRQYGILNLDNSLWTYQYLFMPSKRTDQEVMYRILQSLENNE